MTFFLLFVMPFLLGRFLSPAAAGRWLLGLLLGVSCYSIFIVVLGYSRDPFMEGSTFYTGVGMTGAILGATSGLSLGLTAKDRILSVGVGCLLVAISYLAPSAYDFWGALHTTPIQQRYRVMVWTSPGLLWSELLVLRGVWLIRHAQMVPAQSQVTI